mmetsp:Transcript_90088/g.125159  ORF Transcript_90088/g.125159 Transcript_90088/m.125159 type:complete len:201 (-) Transcript_90088:98-700(-)
MRCSFTSMVTVRASITTKGIGRTALFDVLTFDLCGSTNWISCTVEGWVVVTAVVAEFAQSGEHKHLTAFPWFRLGWVRFLGGCEEWKRWMSIFAFPSLQVTDTLEVVQANGTLASWLALTWIGIPGLLCWAASWLSAGRLIGRLTVSLLGGGHWISCSSHGGWQRSGIGIVDVEGWKLLVSLSHRDRLFNTGHCFVWLLN